MPLSRHAAAPGLQVLFCSTLRLRPAAVSKGMAVVLDLSNPRPRHPEKAQRPDSAQPKKPDWIRVKAPVSQGFFETQSIMRTNSLHTVCEEAGCPNIGECWEKKHATFMIMGDTCTRACAFCNVKTGLPGALDTSEPEHVAQATAKLGLAHIVVTSVDRDDLADGGARISPTPCAPSARAARRPPSRCSPPISCARTARSKKWSKQSPTRSTIIWKPCPRSISRCGRARAISIRCGCCNG